HALFQQHRWLDALLFVLLVALVALVAAFYISGNDFTESLSSDESTPAETETSAQGGEDQAADGDVAESEVDDAGAAGTTEGDVAGTQPAEGDLAPLLDLARQVTAYTEAANVAVSADDKKTAYENIRAIGPLMTQYIDAGGDYRMPDFSKAQGEWMLAGNAYVSGDTGAIARMQASYADMVEALSAYEAEAASSR
ncbi:MAG: hypothetical protein JXA36_00725, partial [Coriobacteriia bacterium]|nr:hypothetical protein [Coriobacteriia bacterium]